MKTKHPIIILWFRNDLRLEDNPALSAACSQNHPIIPLYIHNDTRAKWSLGGASRWWLGRSLGKLDAQLRALGSRLIIRPGRPSSVLEQLAGELPIRRLFYNRRYDPQGIEEQASLEQTLKRHGIAAESFNGTLLYEPDLVKNRSGDPFKVFTPFWKTCLEAPGPASSQAVPREIPSPGSWPRGDRIEQPGLKAGGDDKSNWDAHWEPGAEAAKKMLSSFLAHKIRDYGTDRDRPDVAGTSRLSPYLHFGEISARQIWNSVQKSAARKSGAAKRAGADAYLRQLVWREFAHYLLHHFPFTMEAPLRPEFEDFSWRERDGDFDAWCRGETGYPIVDAGMRELAQSGWMHNRVRMIAASFLVKDLLIPWQRGAEWFWDRLVDADPANNTLGWQWVAGCGADAAPFFRIFNPILQGEKFDPGGSYVRMWIPALGRVPDKWVHRPWEAPAEILAKAGVRLGRDYPVSIVDHFAARQRALDAYHAVKSKK